MGGEIGRVDRPDAARAELAEADHPVLLIMPRGRRIEEGAGDDHDPSDDGIPIGHAVRRDRFRKAVLDDTEPYLSWPAET
jgi:hypothetical protein